MSNVHQNQIDMLTDTERKAEHRKEIEGTRRLEKQFTNFLKGKVVSHCRYMTPSEAKKMGWTDRPLIIVFTDGTGMYASRDDEGNDGGAIFTNDPNNDCFPVDRYYFG